MTKRSYGSGSIFQTPAGKWRAVATVEGRRISKTFTTQKAAGAWLRETTLQAEQGMGYDAARTRLGEFMDAWMATKTPGLRMATIESYSAQIGK